MDNPIQTSHLAFMFPVKAEDEMKRLLGAPVREAVGLTEAAQVQLHP